MEKHDNRLGLGIIGLGGFGQFLIQQWGRLSEIRIAALSDLDPARAPVPLDAMKFYTDEKALVMDPDVDIVSIATPPGTHKSIALHAISEGKHVLIEKPLALTYEDAVQIKDAAVRAGVVATVNFMLRYDPLVVALKQVVEQEIFGKLRRLDLRNYATQDTVPQGHWFWNPEASGGILIEHGVHFFDMASWLAGAPATKVTGLTVERKPGMEDRVFAAVEYESGVVGTFWHSFSRPTELERTTFHMAFDLGEIEVRGWVPLAAKYWGWVNDAGQTALTGLLPDSSMKIELFPQREVKSSEFTYTVSRSVKGEYELPQPKLEIYGECLRSIVSDMIEAITKPDHKMRVTAEDGVEAVAIAEEATKAAHSLVQQAPLAV